MFDLLTSLVMRPSCCDNASVGFSSTSPSNDLLLCCQDNLFSLSPSLVPEESDSNSSPQLLLSSAAINEYNVNNETYDNVRTVGFKGIELLCVIDNPGN